MAEPTLVGSTRVSVIPDVTRFGPELLSELPKAVRPAAERAGDVIGDTITRKLNAAVAKMRPRIRVGVDLDDVMAKTGIRELTKPRTVKVTAELDDKAATSGLTKLTADRTVKVTAQLDDKAATAAVTKLIADRTLKITAKLDSTAAELALGKLTRDSAVDISVSAKINDAAYRRVERALDKLTADRTVNIRATTDTRVAANEIQNLIRRRVVRVRADVDTRVAANDLANLTRARMARVTARTDTTAANAALLALTRDRTVDVRTRLLGVGSLTSALGGLGSSAGDSGGGLAKLPSKILLIGGAILSTLPTIASFGSALAQLGPLAALAGPAILTLGSAFAAIKVGTSGVSEAIKATFADTSAEATAAATATRQVENAQRSLANAQRGVRDAERGLTEAQRTARQAQMELSAARRQAARDLEDMNRRLRQGALDQRQAALDVQQAEVDLAAVRTDPAATQLQIQQADLALVRAKASAEEQSRQQKRLQVDTAAANKAGVSGAEGVVQARERIRTAGLQVEQQERAVQDAHRAVADAARTVAQAQSSAAVQTSKLDTAMAKLSPNARTFVNVLRDLAPAWTALKLDVQDRLFAGLGERLRQVSKSALPVLREGLAGTAGVLGTMGKNALTAVENLAKSGQLKGAFDVVRNGLNNMNRIPGQIVTGLTRLTIAAGPAWDRITAGAGSFMDKVTDRLAKALENGKLTDAINTALDVAISFGEVLADTFGILKNVMGAASEAGGDFFAVVGSALKEIRRVTALPEVQDALKAIFTALNAVAKLVAGALGAALLAVMPVLAALAPVVTKIAGLLGPAIAELFRTLGEALLPVAKSLGPVLVVAAEAIIALVKAVSPLLPVLGKLIGDLLPLVVPIFDLMVTVFDALAPVIAQIAAQLGPILTPIIEGLAAVIGELTAQYATQFLDLLQELLPVLPMLTPAFIQLADSIGQILIALAPLLPQLLLLSTQVLVELLPALLPLMPPLIQLSTLMTELAVKVLVGFVIPALVRLVDYLAGLKEKFQPAIKAVKWLTDAIAKGFDWLYDKLLGRSIIPDIVNGAIKWFTSLKTKAGEIFQAISTAVSEKWSALWGNVRSVASSAWRLVREGFDTFAEGLTSAFETLKKGLGKVWNGLKALVKAPVKFWIETVYNQGIVKVWEKTAAKIPGIDPLKEMPLPKGFARGGILPGYSTYRQGDDQLVPMRRGEGVYVSEAMQDPYERARLHAVNQAAMRGQSLRAFRGFAEGGIFDGISSAVGSVLSKGADVARGGLANLADAAFKPVKSGIRKALGDNTNTYPGLVGALPIGVLNKVVDYIRGKDILESTGQWLKPVDAPYGTPFGKPGLMWTSGRHTGLDFPAQTGASIRAVDNGQVRTAASSGPYGQHIEIAHGGGLSSLYAHMSAMVAKATEGVTRGQVIGKVGATGNTTGPHLHLEARQGGKTVDPMRYLEGGTGGEAGAGVERFRGVVTQALGQVGQSLSLVNTTLRRMNQESGGNTKAVNRNDINWINGYPSVGLMQVIRPTFEAFAGKYKQTGPKMYGVSIDPMANVYASMRYALKTYGSLSAAYNRIGGYATGGIVGGGVQISTGLRRGGYATGGIIRVGGRRIDTGPLAAAVGANFLKALTGTASAISTAMTQVATAVKNAFKGVKTTLDDRLIRNLNAQNKALQSLANKRDALRAKISQARTFATETTSNAAGFASLTGLPNSGLPFGASGILAGLNVRLGQLKAFSANIATLGKRGLSKALIGQLIQAGPDQGAPYAAALVKATSAQLKSINATQTQIVKASSAYGNTAADVMFDAGSMAGKGFLTGLVAQESAIVKALASLAKKVQKTLKVELKISSPSKVAHQLGLFTGQGFEGGIRASIPGAASAAVAMAQTVRSTVKANSVSRLETNTINNQGGERHLHYNAAVTEVAPKRSILDALAQEDMLHRPVMSGAS
ncbi:peptidoglycan DD-metalloendopeptidase family protein [Streptomyces sp. ISL-112]|uniref:peptidoglycan DD-metalloendopeptidase family protein n=1 Tax=unclassified Streptomyces TaxID=2593676 RepID=UPI001BEB96FB|nr:MULTISPECIES: peptidoglycan DD-metalloendopeptidase family protein [unclassified Streptomyces]MBT2425233.1 peptidoglycan DD-metalloendopeptidase family protein [Streptomyces sp. ISL-112]MBT2462024.1 peptidoglycan DD-metalloendopeptidase family protein [Streptomyces sp. ISL-63]